MVLYADRGPDVAAAVITMVRCIACAFTGIGATNATLALPGNRGYQETGLFWFFIFEIFYCVNIIPVKLSISLSLIRIAENRRVYVHVQYAVIAMFTIMNLVAGFYIIFHCNPVRAAWDMSALDHGGKCNPSQYLANIYYATTAVNIFTDWVTAFMPIPLLWNVQLNRNTKISVICLLGLGFFASISACVRLRYTVNLTAQEDYLYALADIVIWGYAENGLGLIVGCVMTLRPLLRNLLNLGGGGGTSNNNNNNNNNNKQSHSTGGNARYGFGSSSLRRRTYEECDSEHELREGDLEGEIGHHVSSSSSGYGNGMTLTEILGGKPKERDGSSFETESQRKMTTAGDGEEVGGGIVVTRLVKLAHNTGAK
ncbi:hypothetical protein N658DRAFT_431025 [Parathielavia hyrcaniae]|uniref:Rhodopsin domain-containing protein n=1 Tax=Parathielavia hyrcaniae TaxID=113614 RepID=A0AAN6PZB0_9PEZI|nr:hypothetical protein N658DRAFT_431025 [Parathielavia hyrcaniae]